MHIPDGFISGPLNVLGGAVAVAAVGASAWRASREVRERPHTLPLLATTAAFVFAAQMLNFPIAGGTSGHFLGAATVAALLGPWSACLVMALVLFIQCLGFADGGITALGTNIMNMAVVAGFGGYVLMRALRALLPAGRGGYLAAAAVASWASVVAASSVVAVELALSGTSPLRVVLPAMAGTHALIGIGEAMIAVAVLGAVAAARPDVLPEWARCGADAAGGAGKRRRVWPLAAAGLALAAALAVFASPFASSHPDGFERVTEDQGIETPAEPSWRHAPMPDYSVPGVRSEGLSTGLAGLTGTAAVFAVGFGLIRLVGARSGRREA